MIGEILKRDALDIGFHKLGFIIKSNIINAFKVGLINDHWAILPYIRGRSVIEYSLLFGVPVVATAHLVREEVDSGGIISVYQYSGVENKYSRVKQVRNHIRKERAFRAVDCIEVLAKTKRTLVENNIQKGLMFYSMHPRLISFIEDHILKG